MNSKLVDFKNQLPYFYLSFPLPLPLSFPLPLFPLEPYNFRHKTKEKVVLMDKAPNVISELTHFQRQSHNLSGGSDVLETGGVVESFHIWVFHISFPLPLISKFKDAEDTENYFIKGWL